MPLQALLFAVLAAQAAELPRSLEVGLTAVKYETPVRAAKRGNSPAEHEVWDFSDLEGKFLTAHYGLAPKYPTGAAGTRKGRPVRIGGFPAKNIAFKREGELYREVLVDFGDEIFPAQVHFYYHGLSKSRAALADRIIATIRRL